MSRRLRALVATSVAALLAPVVVSSATPAAAVDGAAATGPTVSQLSEPHDVEDLDAPLLAWQVPFALQSAYRVQVARVAEGIGAAQVWDSGRVTSSASTNVPYAGPALQPEQTYQWRVRTWDAAARAPSGRSRRRSPPRRTALGRRRPHLARTRRAIGWGDVTIDTTFRINAQNATIAFRAPDANNYYMWQFRGDGVNTFAPHKRVNGTFTQLASVPLATPLVRGTSYRLRIQAEGTTIRTWLDDQLIDTRTLTDFAAGSVGFRTGGSERNAWDALTVTSATGEVLYANDFAGSTSDFTCGTVAGGWLEIGTNANCIYGVESQDWAFLRHEFAVQDKPVAAATLFATASSTAPGRQFVYKAWLNGRFVGLGPTQPIRGEARYDGFDVTESLRQGADNAIGILGWTSSDRRFLARLVVEYADGTRDVVVSGPQWRSLAGARVYPSAGSIGTSVFTAPKENLQAAEWPEGFAEPGFDDSAWRPAGVRPPSPT